jgi:hypothetical protein
MSTAAPHDGGSNLHNLGHSIKEHLKHPGEKLSHKLENTTLHDVKVSMIHKK